MTKKTSAKAPAKKAKAALKKPITPKAATTEAAEEVEAVIEEVTIQAPAPVPSVAHNAFYLKLSDSLARKIREQAEEEGLSPDELAAELLTEGVVVRAWEIVERRITMRQGVGNKPQHANGNGNNNSSNNNGNMGGQRNGGGRRHNNRRGGMSNNRYQNIMEDRASFLEYVRNQERQGR
jgi:hypothetical protein